MKASHKTFSIALMALAACNVQAKDNNKQDICHFDKDLNEFKIINISSKAVASHMSKHGDAMPTDLYFDTDGDGYGDPTGAVVQCPTEGYVNNNIDLFPTDPNEWADTDGDGVGNNADACPDEAGEGEDGCPLPTTKLGSDLVIGQIGEFGKKGNMRIKFNDGQGSFNDTDTLINTWEKSITVKVADINGDGKDDIIMAQPCSSQIGGRPPCVGSIFTAIGPFSAGSQVTFNHAGTYTASNIWNTNNRGGLFTLSDVNNDGKLDAIISGWETHSSLLGNGDGTFAAATAFNVGNFDFRGINSADVDGDGNVDVAIFNGRDGYVDLHFGNGTGNFAGSGAVRLGGRYEVNGGIFFGDVDADGDLDVVTGGGPSPLRVFTNLGNRQFVSSDGGTAGEGMGAGLFILYDLNGDNVVDAITNGPNDTMQVRINDGSGNFSHVVSYPAGYAPRDATIADINQDGKADVVVSNAHVFGDLSNTNNLTIMLGSGDGTFFSVYNVAGYRNNASVAAGNFD